MCFKWLLLDHLIDKFSTKGGLWYANLYSESDWLLRKLKISRREDRCSQSAQLTKIRETFLLDILRLLALFTIPFLWFLSTISRHNTIVHGFSPIRFFPWEKYGNIIICIINYNLINYTYKKHKYNVRRYERITYTHTKWTSDTILKLF